jgi:hypothetical protein
MGVLRRCERAGQPLMTGYGKVSGLKPNARLSTLRYGGETLRQYRIVRTFHLRELDLRPRKR